VASVECDWRFARLWLHGRLTGDSGLAAG